MVLSRHSVHAGLSSVVGQSVWLSEAPMTAFSGQRQTLRF